MFSMCYVYHCRALEIVYHTQVPWHTGVASSTWYEIQTVWAVNNKYYQLRKLGNLQYNILKFLFI